MLRFNHCGTPALGRRFADASSLVSHMLCQLPQTEGGKVVAAVSSESSAVRQNDPIAKNCCGSPERAGQKPFTPCRHGASGDRPPALSGTTFINAKRLAQMSESFVLALPILAVSHPTTIVGGIELNFCVRDGNRWTLDPINTNYFPNIPVLKGNCPGIMKLHPEN